MNQVDDTSEMELHLLPAECLGIAARATVDYRVVDIALSTLKAALPSRFSAETQQSYSGVNIEEVLSAV